VDHCPELLITGAGGAVDSVIGFGRSPGLAAELGVAGLHTVTEETIVTVGALGRVHNLVGRFVAAVQGAGVPVVQAGRLATLTAHERIAGLGAIAELSIITIQGRAPGACALRAGVLHGARIAIPAGEIVGFVGAAQPRLAAIVGARISVIAAQGALGRASSARALLIGRAGVTVVTGGVVGGEDAASTRAQLIGAGVAVITRDLRSALAEPSVAQIAYGAGVPIAAICVHESVVTATIGRADIDRAGVCVITGEAPRPDTSALNAGVARRAGVLVVAGSGVGHKGAADKAIAPVIGARVVVVAFKGDTSRGAGALSADVAQGARVTVVAGQRVGDRGASGRGIASV
jgi:hypothetical protein